MKTYIPIVIGTAREGRQSEYVAQYVYELLKQRQGVEFELIDVRDFLPAVRTIPPWEKNDITKPWRDIVAKSTGFIFVVPEYNRGYPGEFKMLLDQEFKGYEGRPALIVSVSSGNFGGVRMAEHLVASLRYMGFRILSQDIQVPQVEEFVKMNKEEKDKMLKQKIEKLVESLV